MEYTQLSLFDVVAEPTPTPTPTATTPKKQVISPAKVPDEEYEKRNIPNIPTVKDILKTIEKGIYKVGTHELLADTFECGAIAISNKFDFRNFAKREEKYLQIMKKHTPDVQKLISEIFTQIYALLSTQMYNGFDDYLGQLYMQSNTSSSKAGQFFTPYCVSKMMSKCVIDAEQVQEHIENDKILTMNEPTCGSGGTILAATDILYNEYHFNISRNLFVECNDIDSRCVHMTYLQLALAGIPAVIYHRNTLTMETWDKWETPAYIMQFTRFHKLGG